MLEECEMHVAAEEKRMDISKDRLDKSSRVLTDAKSGIEHLAKKLFAIKTVKITFFTRFLAQANACCEI